MTLRIKLSHLALVASLASPAIHAGCSDEANTPVAKDAEQATGINPDSATTKSIQTKRDVIIVDNKKVEDANTGQVIRETTARTPVTIIEEKSEKTNVKVNVGDTKTSGTSNASAPASNK